MINDNFYFLTEECNLDRYERRENLEIWTSHETKRKKIKEAKREEEVGRGEKSQQDREYSSHLMCLVEDQMAKISICELRTWGESR